MASPARGTRALPGDVVTQSGAATAAGQQAILSIEAIGAG